jgi:hypothetical protein
MESSYLLMTGKQGRLNWIDRAHIKLNAVNEHHIIQSVKEVSEQQAENTSNVSATVVKKN